MQTYVYKVGLQGNIEARSFSSRLSKVAACSTRVSLTDINTGMSFFLNLGMCVGSCQEN